MRIVKVLHIPSLNDTVIVKVAKNLEWGTDKRTVTLFQKNYYFFQDNYTFISTSIFCITKVKRYRKSIWQLWEFRYIVSA